MWCRAVRCGVVWCGVVWCGVVWCGVVWCGVVWCGLVWCGVDITVHLTVVVLVSLNITSSSAHSSDSPVISFLYRAELL